MVTATHPPSADSGPQPPAGNSTPLVADRTASALAAGAVGAVVLMAALVGRDLWFFSDEWNILAGYTRGNLLEPFNSHLSLIPAGAFQTLFRTVGVSSYVPYRVLGLGCYALMGAMVWRYGRDRVGAIAGALACTWIVWGSGGVTNLMLPFLLNFSLPIAATAAVFWHLDRDQPRSDRWASAWLTLGLATSGLGLMIAAAVVVELTWMRAPIRRWLTLAPGPILWLAWYLVWGVENPPNSGLSEVVPYALRMLWGGALALGANSPGLGLVILIMLAVVVARGWRDDRVPRARLAASWSMPVVFAALTAWSRTGVLPRIPPDELRYRWTVAAFLVLAAVSAIPPQRCWPVARSTRLAVLAVGALIVAGAVLLVRDSSRWSDTVADALPGLEAVTFATEAGGPAVSRDRVIPLSFVPVRAGDYLDAVAAFGSPLTRIDLDRWTGRVDQRLAADEILADATTSTSPRPTPARPCRDLPVDRRLAPGTVLRFDGAGGSVTVRRFLLDADPTAPSIDLPAGRSWLTLPGDPPSASGSMPYRIDWPSDTLATMC